MGNILPLLDICFSLLDRELGLPFLPSELRKIISDLVGLIEPMCRFVVVHRARDYVLPSNQALRDVIVRALISYWFYSKTYSLVMYESKQFHAIPMSNRLELAYQDHQDVLSLRGKRGITEDDDIWWRPHASVGLSEVASRKQYCWDVLQGNIPLDICIKHLFQVQSTGVRHYRPVRSVHAITAKGQCSFVMRDPHLPRVDDQAPYLYY